MFKLLLALKRKEEKKTLPLEHSPLIFILQLILSVLPFLPSQLPISPFPLLFNLLSPDICPQHSSQNAPATMPSSVVNGHGCSIGLHRPFPSSLNPPPAGFRDPVVLPLLLLSAVSALPFCPPLRRRCGWDSSLSPRSHDALRLGGHISSISSSLHSRADDSKCAAPSGLSVRPYLKPEIFRTEPSPPSFLPTPSPPSRFPRWHHPVTQVRNPKVVLDSSFLSPHIQPPRPTNFSSLILPKSSPSF